MTRIINISMLLFLSVSLMFIMILADWAEGAPPTMNSGMYRDFYCANLHDSSLFYDFEFLLSISDGTKAIVDAINSMKKEMIKGFMAVVYKDYDYGKGEDKDLDRKYSQWRAFRRVY